MKEIEKEDEEERKRLLSKGKHNKNAESRWGTNRKTIELVHKEFMSGLSPLGTK